MCFSTWSETLLKLIARLTGIPATGLSHPSKGRKRPRSETTGDHAVNGVARLKREVGIDSRKARQDRKEEPIGSITVQRCCNNVRGKVFLEFREKQPNSGDNSNKQSELHFSREREKCLKNVKRKLFRKSAGWEGYSPLNRIMSTTWLSQDSLGHR
jgi:hypothetical protein